MDRKKRIVGRNSIWNPIRLGSDNLMRTPQHRSGFFGFKSVPIWRNNNIGNITKRNLTWSQAQVRYPRMDPFGDADRDGKLNMFDCRPFDRKRQDEVAFDESGKIILPKGLTQKDITREKVEKTEAEKEEILKNMIFKRLRQEHKAGQRKGTIAPEKNYRTWVTERKAQRESKEDKRIADLNDARDVGLSGEDDLHA